MAVSAPSVNGCMVTKKCLLLKAFAIIYSELIGCNIDIASLIMINLCQQHEVPE